MVFNEEILFIHIGKTGGTSAAEYLCKTLASPVYNVIPERAINGRIGHEISLIGQRHATLEEARDFLSHRNKSLDSFEEILGVIRNPYFLEVSLFNYYKRLISKQPDILDNAPKRKEIVLKDSFEMFVKGKFYHRHGIHIKKYLSIGGKIRDNVRIIRFENLEEEFISIGEKYGNSNSNFPHLNKTKKVNIAQYYNQELERIVYNKYRWVFKVGNYKRLKLNN